MFQGSLVKISRAKGHKISANRERGRKGGRVDDLQVKHTSVQHLKLMQLVG